jgi:hypothetical protein
MSIFDVVKNCFDRIIESGMYLNVDDSFGFYNKVSDIINHIKTKNNINNKIQKSENKLLNKSTSKKTQISQKVQKLSLELDFLQNHIKATLSYFQNE